MDGRPLIAIFCNSFPPEGGAASNRMFRMARLLHQNGYRVEVVSSMPNYPHGKMFAGYRGMLSRRDEVDGIPVQRCWIFPSNSRYMLPRALNLVTQLISFRNLAFRRIRDLNPALVIASSPPLPMASAAVAYFRKAGVPVLLNVSDLWPLSAKVLGAAGESPVYRHLQKLEHRMYRDATAVSGQSRAILEHIAAVAPHKPGFLLRNLPMEASAFTAASGNRDPARFRIVYPGLLGHAQGLLGLVGSTDWKALPASLDIYGSGAETVAIRDWLNGHPEAPVQLHDPVPESRLRQLLPDFDAMLIPLVSDIPGAVPSKLFTAIHAGLPVLYSAGGEGAGIVRELGIGLLSPPGDYVALGCAIRQLAAMSPEERYRMHAALTRAASSDFDPHAQDKALLAFIRKLTSGGS